MTCTNANVNGTITSNNAVITGGSIHIKTQPGALGAIFSVSATDNSTIVDIDSFEMYIHGGSDRLFNIIDIDGMHNSNYDTNERTDVSYSGIKTPKLTQTSLAEQKKNFEKMTDNALEILKNIDIYKYNLKSEKDTDKKHLGFVIGDGYNYSREVTSIDNDGVDNYSFTSLCCKAIQEQDKQVQEQQRQIEEQQKQIEELNNEVLKLRGE